ncbi:glycyl-radical enzyme activating protein family [Clostridium thermobutyricum]|uniref:Glycyl-radical enzyme activating protein family n=1 Tax=Clostridium thermobutyricum TaxID=29372 RepID=N9XJ61_9CLOT|nr:glycyl-radical enzyme activating protein [Clostridium thermobutyricum]ENY99702.1 glycyl-radical enzyme activating protein family [Clostridium thermobutyricum]
MENKGIIFNIQKFSIHDGPGIRTTVFFKGCPLKCKWCSNPESQLNNIEIHFDESKCSKCKTCVSNCNQNALSLSDNKITIDNKKCIGCLKCVSICPNKAIENEGNYKEIKEVIYECLKDKDFYEESNGGVTISGGEGMCQPDFLKELVLYLKKENIHIAIETTGYIEHNLFKELAILFDLLLFDVKHYDRNKHFEGTGVYNDLIIKNLKWAIEHKINILIRIPVIPEFNSSLEDAYQLSDLLKSIGVKNVQLLPFHQFGEKKYDMLNKTYELKDIKPLRPETLENYKNIFIDKGLNCFF